MNLNINIKLEDHIYTQRRPRRCRIRRCPYKRWREPGSFQNDINMSLHYLRMQAPMLKTLFSEYKMKWDKSQRRRIARSNNLDVEDSDYSSDTSNGTVTSNIAFGYPNAESDDDDDLSDEPESTEMFRAGYYLLISYEQGGWTYPEVKRYFMQKHGCRCFRSKTINDALKGTNNFQALIKFRTRKALDDVCKILARDRM